MKRKFKGLMALWLVLALVAAMVLPVVAEQGKSVQVYEGTTPLTPGAYASPYTEAYQYDPGTPINTLYVPTDKTSKPYFNKPGVVGWKLWSGNSGYAYEVLDEVAADAVLPDNWPYDYYLEPIYPEITHQPTSAEPYVEVSHPENATYQWYSTSAAKTLTIPVTGNDVESIYVGSDSDNDGTWDSAYYTETESYYIAFSGILSAGQSLKVTPLNNADVEIMGRIDDYYNSDELTFEESDGSYVAVAEYDGYYSIELSCSADFYAKFEISTMYDQTAGETLVYDENYTSVEFGEYNSASKKWTSESLLNKYDYANDYINPDNYIIDVGSINAEADST